MTTQLDENTQYIDEATGELLNNGYIYIGTDGLDAKLNLQSIYSNRELITQLSNPQRIGADGRALNKIWIDGKYSMKVESSEKTQKLNDLSLGELTQTDNTTLINVQGTDSLTANAAPTITSLTINQVYIFTAANTNTGAMTLTIDLTPTWPIKKHYDNDMLPGDVEAGQTVAVIWNENDSIFELMTNSAIGPVNLAGNQTIAGTKTFSSPIIGDLTGDSSGEHSGTLATTGGTAEGLTKLSTANLFTTPPTTSGTSTAYTATVGETAYVTDRIYSVQIHTDNTGACTLALDGLTTESIKLLSGVNPHAGALQIGIPAKFLFDGTDFILLNPSTINFTELTVSQFGGDYFKISDTKASNTQGGTSTSATTHTRTLNTENTDTGNVVTLSSNQFTLIAGTYIIHASAPAYDSDGHKARLYNITDSVYLTGDEGGSARATGSVSTRSYINLELTISVATTFELRHYTQGGVTSFGLGVAVVISSVDEVYSVVEGWRVK